VPLRTMHNASMVRYVDFAIGHGINHSIIATTANIAAVAKTNNNLFRLTLVQPPNGRNSL
jgi:hypothetical protein